MSRRRVHWWEDEGSVCYMGGRGPFAAVDYDVTCLLCLRWVRPRGEKRTSRIRGLERLPEDQRQAIVDWVCARKNTDTVTDWADEARSWAAEQWATHE